MIYFMFKLDLYVNLCSVYKTDWTNSRYKKNTAGRYSGQANSTALKADSVKTTDSDKLVPTQTKNVFNGVWAQCSCIQIQVFAIRGTMQIMFHALRLNVNF